MKSFSAHLVARFIVGHHLCMLRIVCTTYNNNHACNLNDQISMAHQRDQASASNLEGNQLVFADI